MKKITISNFFDTLSRKMISSFFTKDSVSRLEFFKLENTIGIDSRNELVKIKNTLLSFAHYCLSKWGERSLFSFRNLLLFFLLNFAGLSTAIAQTTTTFPSPDRCTSKDLELVSATLTGGDACNSCTPGSNVTRTLTLGINNKTGSSRTAFAFWGTLEITHSNGIVETTPISRCSDSTPIPPTGPLPAAYTGGSFGTITYQCGDALRLINLYLAWTDASPKSTCSSLNSATISPKCGTLPSIQINAGVNGTLTAANATCTAGGSITVAPFGGKPPYAVKLGNGTPNNVPAGSSTTFSGLAANTYNITITDSNNCSIVIPKIVGGPTAIPAPAATVTQPTCSTATGTVTVTSPTAGLTYTLKQSGVIIYTANSSGVFSPVASGTYQFFASLGTCSTQGDNVIVNPQPGTPDAPQLKIIQPTASLCGATTTGSIEVCNPAVGYIYKLYLNGVLNATTAPYVSGSIIFSNLAAGSNPSVTATTGAAAGGCTSVPTTCSSATATCPAPLAGKIAAPATPKDTAKTSKTEATGFEAYPVPFKDQLTIRYNFDYLSDVKIEVFNAQGIRILSKTDTNSYLNKEITLDLHANKTKEQMYIVKLTTDRESSTKKVLSSQ